jgi:hypothetical protein
MRFPHPLSYFTREDYADIAAAETYGALRDIALRVLHRMPLGVSMVCGPISTGGLGSIEKNLVRFSGAIEVLAGCDQNVFTQMPFEEAMRRIRGNAPPYEEGLTLLETFYFAIFSSGRVVRLCFIPGWESSLGTNWEHKQGEDLGLEHKYFRDDFGPHITDITLLFK